VGSQSQIPEKSLCLWAKSSVHLPSCGLIRWGVFVRFYLKANWH